MDNKEIIVIKDAKVLFADLEDKGYGRNVTIEVTDAMKSQIEKWGKDNGFEPRFKEYTNKNTDETTLQFTLKMSKFTEIDSEVSKEAGYGLRRGAVINLQARTFKYNNKFGSGTSASIAGIYVVKPAQNSMMENLKK